MSRKVAEEGVCIDKKGEKLKDWTSAPNRENKQTKIITAHKQYDSSSPSE